jgi:hypothetical protein
LVTPTEEGKMEQDTRTVMEVIADLNLAIIRAEVEREMMDAEARAFADAVNRAVGLA